MKRFLFLIVLVMLVFWVMARHRSAQVPHHRSWPVHHADAERRIAHQPHQQTRQAFAEARRALREAHDEVREAFAEARNEIREAFDEARVSLVDDDDPPRPPAPAPSAATVEREEAEGLPVPIVPGTRVTVAEPRPPVPPRAQAPKLRPVAVTRGAAASAAFTRVVEGAISASEERAKAAARVQLRDDVAQWLEPDVPASWAPPQRLLEAMIVKTDMKETVKDYGTIYVAELTLDTSPQRRATFVNLYTRELVARRMVTLGGALTFVLICLGAISGYIRADEATKGYYTNRLRLLAAAGVGAAGVLIYQMVA
jgi:hypothetical protein